MPYLLLLALLSPGPLPGESQGSSIPAGQARQCVIHAPGRVSVKGTSGVDLTYRLIPRRGPAAIPAAAIPAAAINVQRLPGGVLRLSITDGPGIESDLEIALPPSFERIAVESRTGPIDLHSLDAEVTARSSAGNISVDRLGRAAVLRTGGGEIRAGILAGALKAYSGAGSIIVGEASEVFAATQGGEIQVREAHGPVTAHTAGGNIRIERAGGPVDARTGSGVIVIGSAGPVTAVTGGGSIEISRAGPVDVTSGLGSLRLKDLTGPVMARTGGGVILAELAPNRSGPASFQSLNGDIVLLLPSNLAMTVEAVSWSAGKAADIRSDFPGLQLRPETRGDLRGVAAQLALHGGGTIIRLEAAGRIDLRRRESGSRPDDPPHRSQRKKLQER